MPSAWTQHLSAYRASHPYKSMKECMIEASACYRKSGVAASKVVSAPRPGSASVKKRASRVKHLDAEDWMTDLKERAKARESFNVYVGGKKVIEFFFISWRVDIALHFDCI